MKRISKYQIIIVIVLFVNVLQNIQAQDIIPRPRRVELCVMAGPTISWASTKSETFKNKGICAGGVYGINVDINLVPTNENYYFMVGLNAQHKFMKVNYEGYYDYFGTNTNNCLSNIVSKYNDIYLTFPTAIKLKTNPFGRFTIYGVVGLEHSFCLSAKSKDMVTPIVGKDEILPEKTFKLVNRSPQTSIFNESLYVVFGFEFSIQDHTKATFGLAFNRGLNNLFRNTYKNESGNNTENINTYTNEKFIAFYNNFEFQFGFIF